ncbi:MAG: hypothetical protein KGJ90_07145 [Patescibacteria group bacterium]|nr:hypothetical protein [Patescibacteria group bacterium]
MSEKSVTTDSVPTLDNKDGEYVVSRRNRMRYNAYQRDYQRQRRAALKQGLTYSRKRGDPDTADD